MVAPNTPGGPRLKRLGRGRSWVFKWAVAACCVRTFCVLKRAFAMPCALCPRGKQRGKKARKKFLNAQKESAMGEVYCKRDLFAERIGRSHLLSGQWRLYSSCSAASSRISWRCNMKIINRMSRQSTAKAIRVEHTKSLMGARNIL